MGIDGGIWKYQRRIAERGASSDAVNRARRNHIFKTLGLQEIQGNRFEKLKGKRKGQYSIRINDQYRICFKWEKENTVDVEIVDYH